MSGVDQVGSKRVTRARAQSELKALAEEEIAEEEIANDDIDMQGLASEYFKLDLVKHALITLMSNWADIPSVDIRARKTLFMQHYEELEYGYHIELCLNHRKLIGILHKYAADISSVSGAKATALSHCIITEIEELQECPIDRFWTEVDEGYLRVFCAEYNIQLVEAYKYSTDLVLHVKCCEIHRDLYLLFRKFCCNRCNKPEALRLRFSILDKMQELQIPKSHFFEEFVGELAMSDENMFIRLNFFAERWAIFKSKTIDPNEVDKLNTLDPNEVDKFKLYYDDELLHFDLVLCKTHSHLADAFCQYYDTIDFMELTGNEEVDKENALYFEMKDPHLFTKILDLYEELNGSVFGAPWFMRGRDALLDT